MLVGGDVKDRDAWDFLFLTLVQKILNIDDGC
jgi:hypothetical protein